MEPSPAASPKEPNLIETFTFLHGPEIELVKKTPEELAIDPDRKHGYLFLHGRYKVYVSYLSVALRDDLWLQPYDHHKVREWDVVSIASGRAQVELRVPGVGWTNGSVCGMNGASTLQAADSESLLAFGVVHIVASALVPLINARFARHKDRLIAEKAELEKADAQEQLKRNVEWTEKYRAAQAERNKKKKRKTTASKKPTK